MIYDYLILRLRPDYIRGEVINVGAIIWKRDAKPVLYFWGTLSKIRAIDARWDSRKINGWVENAKEIIQKTNNIYDCHSVLAKLGICQPNAVGMFVAENQAELAEEIQDLKLTYVQSIGSQDDPIAKERRTGLMAELRNSFKKMKMLGDGPEDLAKHLVVQNLPIPNHPELKADFVYKNGIYRITQTLDYRGSLKRTQYKVKEACTKMVAAQLAKQAWGEETVKIAVVSVPREASEIADPHIDMLLHQGFLVFDANKKRDLAHYHEAAFGDISKKELNHYRLQ